MAKKSTGIGIGVAVGTIAALVGGVVLAGGVAMALADDDSQAGGSGGNGLPDDEVRRQAGNRLADLPDGFSIDSAGRLIDAFGQRVPFGNRDLASSDYQIWNGFRWDPSKRQWLDRPNLPARS